MSMSYADYVIAIVGPKNAVKSLLKTQTLTITSVSIVNLRSIIKILKWILRN